LRKQEALFHLSSQKILAGDFTTAEALLTSDGSLAALRALVFVKLRAGNLTGATSALNQLPGSTLEDEHFELVADAAIQLAASDTATLSSGVIGELIAMAKSHSPLAGRAQALLYSTNGMIFLPELPDEGNNLQSELNEEISISNYPTKIAGDQSLSFSISTYPVPAQDKLWIRASKNDLPISLVVFDIHGRKLRELIVMPEGTLLVPLDEWPTGIYLLRWSESGEMRTTKVIVQH